MYLSGRFVCLDDVAAVREYDVVVFVEGLLQSEKGVEVGFEVEAGHRPWGRRQQIYQVA